jgi:hypothetical protein
MRLLSAFLGSQEQQNPQQPCNSRGLQSANREHGERHCRPPCKWRGIPKGHQGVEALVQPLTLPQLGARPGAWLARMQAGTLCLRVDALAIDRAHVTKGT